MRGEVRALECEGDHLIESSQSLLGLQIMLEAVLFSILEPLLSTVVVFPEEVSADLVIHYALNGVSGIANW